MAVNVYENESTYVKDKCRNYKLVSSKRFLIGFSNIYEHNDMDVNHKNLAFSMTF